MKPRARMRLSRWTGFSLALLFVASTVVAQNAEIKHRKQSQLSSAEMRAQAKKYLASMKTKISRVNKLAARARKEKDIIKLNCINDKLIQIKGSLKVGEDANRGMMRAGDISHEFAKLTIAYQKVSVLSQEAEACIGEEMAYVGDTEVETTVDPAVDQQGDPTVEPPPPVIPVVRPPVASPFQ